MRHWIDLVESIIPLRILNVDLNIVSKPTVAQIEMMVDRYERVRGLACEGVLYLWDGYQAAHFQVAATLGLENCIEFQISNFDDRIRVTIYRDEEALMAVPTFKRFIDRVNPIITA